MNKIDYKSAGVDINRGYEAVQKMKKYVESTYIPGVLGSIGGFGGMFELPKGYEEPVLVCGTDGVGTKLQLAFMTDRHESIGIDCVAMCVNDIACIGAKPLFFLDYIGTGVLEPNQVENIVKGISIGCKEAMCAIIGGETAEMPNFYKKGEYDLAGFSVGVVEKSKIITSDKLKQDNVLIGVSSSGIHSNGYSLVRKLCFDVQKLNVDTFIPQLNKTLGEELLTPTKIYVRLIQNLINKFDINGIAHITGGAWIENIPRILSPDLKAVVTTKNHKIPPIFNLLKEWGNLEDKDMYNTFNMGIGLVVAVDKSDADEVLKEIQKTDDAYIIGKVEKRNGEAEIEFI
jgi:phosphoribosylformylglycinamidine cyclo-ligase